MAAAGGRGRARPWVPPRLLPPATATALPSAPSPPLPHRHVLTAAKTSHPETAQERRAASTRTAETRGLPETSSAEPTLRPGIHILRGCRSVAAPDYPLVLGPPGTTAARYGATLGRPRAALLAPLFIMRLLYSPSLPPFSLFLAFSNSMFLITPLPQLFCRRFPFMARIPSSLPP